jgi:hypothetical protein
MWCFASQVATDAMHVSWQVVPRLNLDGEQSTILSNLMSRIKPNAPRDINNNPRFTKKQFHSMLKMASTRKDRELITAAAIHGLSNSKVNRYPSVAFSICCSAAGCIFLCPPRLLPLHCVCIDACSLPIGSCL